MPAPDSRYDAIVVGAGYIGCAAAYYLAAAGLRTALLDRGPVAAGASRANYGNVQIQDAELAHSLPMIISGFAEFARLEEELHCSVVLRKLGSLLLIETEAQWQTMAARLPALLAAGIHAELLPSERLPEIEPLLDPSSVLGACYNPDEAQVYPFGLMGAYVRRGRERGLDLRTHTEVTGFLEAGGRVTGVRTAQGDLSAGVVVLATGAWTPALGEMLGRRWNIPHVHGQAMVTEYSPLRMTSHLSSAAFFEAVNSDQPASEGDEAVLALAQSAEGHFLLGEASRLTDEIGARTTLQGLGSIAAMVGRYVPSLRKLQVLRGWASPVAFTPDDLPFLGRVDGVEGLIVATAFKSTVIVTPLVGRTVAQLAQTGRSDLDLTAFSPDRSVGRVA